MNANPNGSAAHQPSVADEVGEGDAMDFQAAGDARFGIVAKGGLSDSAIPADFSQSLSICLTFCPNNGFSNTHYQ